MTSSSERPASERPEFFNLFTTGVAYVNRAREVALENGNPYLACSLAALNGPKQKVKYRYIDCSVVGDKAQELIRKYMAIIKDENHKVLCGFKIGDLWVDTFIFQKGPKQGQPGFSLKGRLLVLEWIKVDGEYVYVAAESASADRAVSQEPTAEVVNHAAA